MELFPVARSALIVTAALVSTVDERSNLSLPDSSS
jgi:hypothetical protein